MHLLFSPVSVFEYISNRVVTLIFFVICMLSVLSFAVVCECWLTNVDLVVNKSAKLAVVLGLLVLLYRVPQKLGLFTFSVRIISNIC